MSSTSRNRRKRVKKTITRANERVGTANAQETAGEMPVIELENKKPKTNITSKKKPKRDWVGIVHKGCRVCIFRTIEAVFAFFGVTIITIIIGTMAVPSLSFSMASTAGITQNTDLYTAIGLWLLPVLFFTLLITAATFCVLSRLLKWLHRYFTEQIAKGNKNDDEKRGTAK